MLTALRAAFALFWAIEGCFGLLHASDVGAFLGRDLGVAAPATARLLAVGLGCAQLLLALGLALEATRRDAAVFGSVLIGSMFAAAVYVFIDGGTGSCGCLKWAGVEAFGMWNLAVLGGSLMALWSPIVRGPRVARVLTVLICLLIARGAVAEDAVDVEAEFWRSVSKREAYLDGRRVSYWEVQRSAGKLQVVERVSVLRAPDHSGSSEWWRQRGDERLQSTVIASLEGEAALPAAPQFTFWRRVVMAGGRSLRLERRNRDGVEYWEGSLLGTQLGGDRSGGTNCALQFGENWWSDVRPAITAFGVDADADGGWVYFRNPKPSREISDVLLVHCRKSWGWMLDRYVLYRLPVADIGIEQAMLHRQDGMPPEGSQQVLAVGEVLDAVQVADGVWIPAQMRLSYGDAKGQLTIARLDSVEAVAGAKPMDVVAAPLGLESVPVRFVDWTTKELHKLGPWTKELDAPLPEPAGRRVSPAPLEPTDRTFALVTLILATAALVGFGLWRRRLSKSRTAAEG